MRVFVPGLSGESPLLLRELTDDPERARDVDFIGVQFPGIGHADYLSVHPKARQTTFFMSPSIRNGIREQRADLLSLDYPGIARYLQQCMPFDLAASGCTPAWPRRQRARSRTPTHWSLAPPSCPASRLAMRPFMTGPAATRVYVSPTCVRRTTCRRWPRRHALLPSTRPWKSTCSAR